MFFPEINVVTAQSGEEALEKFATIEGDIVIAFIDYNMEGMNGLELITQLQGVDHSKFLLCTANIQESIYKKAAKQGISLIEKPLTKEKFKTVVNNILKAGPE